MMDTGTISCIICDNDYDDAAYSLTRNNTLEVTYKAMSRKKTNSRKLDSASIVSSVDSANSPNITHNARKISRTQVLRCIGIIMMICGLSMLSLFAYRKISRELYLRKLLDTNINFEIPNLNIKVPVLEGTDQKSLQVSAGHFEGTGALGKGNYCIAGHNSTIYAEIFNDLNQIKIGDEMYLIDIDEHRTRYTYVVTEYKTVEPSDTWVLSDFGDNRLTVISCTDDGAMRQVVVGVLKEDATVTK